MNIIQSILTKNDCYKQRLKLNPKGIVVHSTGCNQPKASAFINNWNKSGVAKCVHAFLQSDGNVYQTLPFNQKCWGCGAGKNGSYNNSHIQFEICEDGLDNADYFNNCYNTAVEFCVFLCKQYGLSADSIVCHSEAHSRGYASNHADVMHWFPKFGKSMDTFRADVKAKLNGTTTAPVNNSKPITNSGSNSNSIVDYLKSIGIDSSYNNRAKLAQQYGISGYRGTASQNIELLNKMRNGSQPSQPINNTTYLKANYNGSSISDALKSIGVDNSYAYRAKLAKANGINNYSGTAAQNTELLYLLKKGKLIKA